MYHTEGYLDKKTYFAKGHIWGNAIMHQGSICYVWCVAVQEKEAECEESVEKNDSTVKQWVYQELVVALGNGQVAVQKELKRFGVFMKKKMYLYYKGHFFTDGEDSSWQFVVKRVGVFVSPTVSGLPEFGQIMQNRSVISGEQITENCSDVSAEQLGNRLKTAMLRAMSEGRLEQGYFLVWEDEDAF